MNSNFNSYTDGVTAPPTKVAAVKKTRVTKPRAKKPMWNASGPENDVLLQLFLTKKIDINADPKIVLQYRSDFQTYDNQSFRNNFKTVKSLAKKIIQQRTKDKELAKENPMVNGLQSKFYFYFFWLL